MIFRDKYWFLSNMYPCRILICVNDRLYKFKCVESAYQCFKNFDYVSQFLPLDGFQAKKLGKQIPIRYDWTKMRLYYMEYLVNIKFQDKRLRRKLSTVHNIVEENTWGDTFWGLAMGKEKII